jgi:Glycosyl hydrolase family 12
LPFWSARRLCAVAGLSALVALAVAACGDAAPVNTIKVHVSLPKHPTWQSTKKLGAWHTGGFVVSNNEWNQSEAGPQTIWANSYRSWGVVTRQGDTTSVKTYPCVKKYFDSTPLSSLTELTSTFTEAMPPAKAGYDAEAAYDLWLDHYKIEVMVWVDNHGQKPAGDVVAAATLGGRRYELYQGGPHMFSFVLAGRQETTGQADLLGVLRWLVSHQRLSRTDTVTEVDFGWEVASTDADPMGFTMSSYSLTTRTASA